MADDRSALVALIDAATRIATVEVEGEGVMGSAIDADTRQDARDFLSHCWGEYQDGSEESDGSDGGEQGGEGYP